MLKMAYQILEGVEGKEIIIESPKERAGKIFDLLDVSESTRQDYKSRIWLFLDFIREKSLHQDSFLEFKRYLKERNDLAVASKNKYLAAARIFLKELNRQGLLPVDITQNIKTFNQSRKHKKEGLSETEVELLSVSVNQLPDTPMNTRLKAVLSLLIFQGLRQIEIVRLDVKDLDLASGTAFIHGKGRDDKELINLHPTTVNAVKSYLKKNKIGDGALFVSTSNNSRNKRLSTRALREMIRGLFMQTGIEKNVHGLRHYFVTRLVREYRGDLLEVARYTRHKSLEMLQIYNDSIRHKADLPRFYKTFEGIKLA